MGQKSNLITLYKNKSSNFYNIEKNVFIFFYSFLQQLKELFFKKNIWIAYEHLNMYKNSLFFNGSLFFGSQSLKILKRKQKIRHFANNKFIFLRKESFIKKIFNKIIKKFNLNYVFCDFLILNKYIKKNILSFLYNKLKIYLKSIFSRRTNLFIDFIKLTCLFIVSKINLEIYGNILMQIFSLIQKTHHNKYIFFIKTIFNILVFELKQQKYLFTIRGIKAVLKGRLRGKAMASSIIVQAGVVPIQSIDKKIDYCKANAFTSNLGVFGLKLWVYKI